MKTGLATALGVAGAFFASLFGGWDQAFATLMICMAVDFGTGLVVAGVFQNSPNSETGALKSDSAWKGLCRKGMTLLVVLIANRLDMAVGSNFIKDGVVIAYIASEMISIIENAGLMGVPIPSVIQSAIDALNSSNDDTTSVAALAADINETEESSEV